MAVAAIGMRGDRKRHQKLSEEDGEQQSPETVVINIKGNSSKRIPQLV
jgi:hypothetical protein